MMIGAILIALGGPGSGRAAAQEKAADFIEPRLDRTEFSHFCQKLNLPSDLRSIAELMYGDYTQTLDDLAKSLDIQANEAGRQSVQDALAGKSRIAPDELKRLRANVLRVYQQGFPEIDKALDDLLSGIENLLTAELAEQFEPAVRELRRDIYLHPRQLSADFQEYAGDGVDVLLLVQNAQAEGGELQAVAPDSLADILATYEMRLDALLKATAAGYRQTKLNRKIASVEKNTEAQRAEDQVALDRWKQLFQLNQSTVLQIADAIAVAPADAGRRRWLDRFDEASFTWLYPRKKPDRQIEWIRKQTGQLTPEALASAELAYQKYLGARHELSRKAIEMMIRGRLEFQVMLYSMMDPTGMDDRIRSSLYDELLKNTGEQTKLENDTVSALEGVLPDAMRGELRNAMKGPDPAARRR